MATGPEHYREAEDWLTVAGNAVGKSSEHVVMAAAMVQAHAALALAAAVGTYGTAEETRTADDANAWEYAAGEYTAQRGRRAARAEVERLEAEAEQAARDAEAADDAMSNSERFEHDQADEFAQDAADAERWAEQNAANQYDDDHYDVDDEDEDGEL